MDAVLTLIHDNDQPYHQMKDQPQNKKPNRLLCREGAPYATNTFSPLPRPKR